MRILRPYTEEIVKITCSCGCEDFIQFDRYLKDDKIDIKEEELYCINIKKDAKNWPFSLKFKTLFDMTTKIKTYKDGENQYYNSNMMNKEQTKRLYDILIEDIEHFGADIADFILKGIEEFSPINKKVNEYTLLIGNFNESLMWIGIDGADLESPPNPVAGFYPNDVVIGWRFYEKLSRKELLRFWRHYFKTGMKYEITEFDGLLNKEDIVVILGSIKYILKEIFKI